MEPVGQFVEQLRAEGVMDSVGSFTVGWAEARRKMQAHQNAAPERYAVLLVSAGLAWGGEAVQITERPDCLTLVFPGAFVEEGQLAGGFANLAGGQCSGALLDFMLGLNGAFVLGSSEVNVEVESQRVSYRWSLTPEGESREAREVLSERGQLSVKIVRGEVTILTRVQAFLRSLRGRVGMGPECRAVDDACVRALVPITINDQSVNRNYQFQPTSVLAQVGSRGCAISGDTEVLQFSESWSGVLAPDMKGGQIELVVHGVTYPGPSLGLQGVIWYDELRRDISRQGIAQDENYERMVERLRKIRSQMLVHLAPQLSELPPDYAAAVGRELVGALREGGLPVEQMRDCLRYGLEYLNPVDKLRLYEAAIESLEQDENHGAVFELAQEALVAGRSQWDKTDGCPERLKLYAAFRTRASLTADGELLKLLRFEMGRVDAWKYLSPEAGNALAAVMLVDLQILATQVTRTADEAKWLAQAQHCLESGVPWTG